MKKTRCKSGMLGVFIGMILSATLMLTGTALVQDSSAMAKETSASKELAAGATTTTITPTLIIKRASLSDDDVNKTSYSTLKSDSEFWLGKNLHMFYAFDRKVAGATLNYGIYDSSNTLVESWSSNELKLSTSGKSYRESYTELKSTKVKSGMTYTLKVSADVSGYTVKTVSASFSIYDPISDIRIDGDANTYVESGTKATLKATATGGKSSSYTYVWGYSTKPSITSWDKEVTTISGATSSTYTFTIGNESNNRYYYCGANDGVGNSYLIKGVYIREKYKIDYSMGHLGNNEILDTDYINSDVKEGYQIPKLNPSLDGYEFKGWATSQGTTTPEYVGGDTFYPKNNVTLYAIWSYKLKLTGDTPITIVYGQSGKNIIDLAQIQPSDASFTFVSSKPSVVSVSSDGTIKAKNYGSANITITAPATETTEEASIKILVKVKPPKVKKLKYTKKSGGAVVITWSKLKKVKKYLVYYKTKKGKKWKVITVSKNKLIQRFINMSGYRIKVRAEAKGVKGEFSKELPIKK